MTAPPPPHRPSRAEPPPAVLGDATLVAVLETVQAIGLVLDVSGNVSFANDFLLALTGWTRDEVLGRSWFDRFLPAGDAPGGGRDALRHRFVATVASGTIFPHHENDIVTRDGARRTVAWDNTLLRDARGAVAAIVSIGRDVTDARATERERRRLAQRFAAAVEAVAEIVWTNDPDGRMRGAQPGWEAYTGQREPEYQGYGWAAAIHPDDAQPTIDAWERAVETRSPFVFEHRVRRHDGEWRRFAVRAAPVLDDDGALLEWVGVHRDVTRERAALAHERAARHEVEAERARAEEANRVKAEFLATMSHELRTPLNAIGGYVQLLELGVHGALAPAQREALERVQSAQRHLLRLINDVLNFAKLEAGTLAYELRAVRVGDLVDAVVPLVAPQVATRGQRLEVALADPDAHVWADREKLVQVLLNLLSNAMRFTGADGRITIGTAPHDVAAGRLALHVHDTGRGIPPSKLESIFEPFVQVETGRTRSHEGTGLGLAISRDLARGMGGDLVARSVEGEGSTFTIVLRRTERHDGGMVDRRVREERRSGGERRQRRTVPER